MCSETIGRRLLHTWATWPGGYHACIPLLVGSLR
jgi:hypothetical protein